MNFIKPCIWERKKNHFLFHALGLKNYLNRYGGHSNKSAVCTFFSKRVFLSHHKKMRNWYKKVVMRCATNSLCFQKVYTLNRPGEPKMHKLYKNKSLTWTVWRYKCMSTYVCNHFFTEKSLHMIVCNDKQYWVIFLAKYSYMIFFCLTVLII